MPTHPLWPKPRPPYAARKGHCPPSGVALLLSSVRLFSQKTHLDRRATTRNLSEKTKMIAHASTRHNFSLVSETDTLVSREPPLAYGRSTEMTDNNTLFTGEQLLISFAPSYKTSSGGERRAQRCIWWPPQLIIKWGNIISSFLNGLTEI